MRALISSMGAVALVGVIALMLLPLPPALLDVFLAFSLGLALLTFMVAIYVERPLDFSSFPSLLLLATLLRLSLNVATTRRILLHGNEGAAAAGDMIRAFGEFAVGGNYVVGAVVFLILVVVNFIVITKGSERISEVAARFTLDSMPGKQMAIDADLGAGLITETQAKERRAGIEQESDFYGTMDGASKFVRGDAIAGLVITVINILGGIIVGVLQHDLSLADAAKTYSILSIGDGLVSQLPALFVSTGAALLTTRGATRGDFGGSLAKQLLGGPKAPFAAAISLGLLALMPGMPLLALLGLGAALMWNTQRLKRKAAQPKKTEPTKAPDTTSKDPNQQKAEITEMLPVDLLSLDVSLDLLPLVDADKGGELLIRIGSLRKQIALDLGLILPPVHVEDDLGLDAGLYRIRISGVVAASGIVRAGRLLAIDPTGTATNGLAGESVKEPTFGLPAKWIAQSDRRKAERAGCTVVDPSAVIATHLTQVVRQNAHELLGRREAQELIDVVAKDHSKLVEELVPNLLSLGEVIAVFRNLLREGVSIRDTRTILEALADHAPQMKETGELTERVRQRLSRRITGKLAGPSGDLQAMILDPGAEDLFRPGRGANPDSLSTLVGELEGAARESSAESLEPVLVVSPDVRSAVAEVALRHVPGLSVISYREVDPATPLVSQRVVGRVQESAA